MIEFSSHKFSQLPGCCTHYDWLGTQLISMDMIIFITSNNKLQNYKYYSLFILIFDCFNIDNIIN